MSNWENYGRYRLSNADCLEAMAGIPANTVDMVLTDPPYGTTACKWDSVIPFAPMWEQLKRIAKKNAAIVMTASQPFTSTLIVSNIDMFKYCWVWKKSKASNFPHAPNMPLKILEDILVFSQGVVGHATQAGGNRMNYYPQGIREGSTVVKRNKNTSELKYHRESQTNHTTGYKCKNEGYPTTLLEIKSENGLHPTQKPVALMEYLIKTYTNENDIVLDFTMGSGTTGVACMNLNRRFIGIEKDAAYYELAKNRIAESVQKRKENAST
jgi:site-specific DNA-methyltransferase (adenine-specific)